jgi:hypothetical protein
MLTFLVHIEFIPASSKTQLNFTTSSFQVFLIFPRNLLGDTTEGQSWHGRGFPSLCGHNLQGVGVAEIE